MVSCRGEKPKIAASRSTSWVVNPRCRPLRRPSAAHTVELLGQPISFCPVPLPSWLSDSGGKGIQVVAVVHGEAQLAERWGDHGR
jgi:hypothetical protein